MALKSAGTAPHLARRDPGRLHGHRDRSRAGRLRHPDLAGRRRRREDRSS
ncbi:MAG: hypothetical protein M0C28_46250 [Candidatus Moduliflexus flocculans]|nr:hypothetical protein [Candidatus Moduliflexus flocculans]